MLGRDRAPVLRGAGGETEALGTNPWSGVAVMPGWVSGEVQVKRVEQAGEGHSSTQGRGVPAPPAVVPGQHGGEFGKAGRERLRGGMNRVPPPGVIPVPCPSGHSPTRLSLTPWTLQWAVGLASSYPVLCERGPRTLSLSIWSRSGLAQSKGLWPPAPGPMGPSDIPTASWPCCCHAAEGRGGAGLGWQALGRAALPSPGAQACSARLLATERSSSLGSRGEGGSPELEVRWCFLLC